MKQPSISPRFGCKLQPQGQAAPSRHGIEIACVPKAVHGTFILGSPVDARPSGGGPVAAGTTCTGVALYISVIRPLHSAMYRLVSSYRCREIWNPFLDEVHKFRESRAVFLIALLVESGPLIGFNSTGLLRRACRAFRSSNGTDGDARPSQHRECILKRCCHGRLNVSYRLWRSECKVLRWSCRMSQQFLFSGRPPIPWRRATPSGGSRRSWRSIPDSLAAKTCYRPAPAEHC
jgi:hypothetical protein